MNYWFRILIRKRSVSILRFSMAKVVSTPLFIRDCSFEMNCRSTVNEKIKAEAALLKDKEGKFITNLNSTP